MQNFLMSTKALMESYLSLTSPNIGKIFAAQYVARSVFIDYIYGCYRQIDR